MEGLKEIEIFLRKSISEEQETVSLYLDRKNKAEELVETTTEEETVKKLQAIVNTLQDIIEEEQLHIGQFTEMLKLLGVTFEKEKEGEKEGKETVDKLESFKLLAQKFKKFL